MTNKSKHHILTSDNVNQGTNTTGSNYYRLNEELLKEYTYYEYQSVTEHVLPLQPLHV